MRINELITPRELTKTTAKPHEPELTARQERNIDYEQPGWGKFSRGQSDPKDPFLYKKKSHLPVELKDDAYYQYIQAAKEHMKSNPYFPRVYKIALHQDPNGKVKPEYNIEQLHTDLADPEGNIDVSHGRDIDAAIAERILYTVPENLNVNGLAMYLDSVARKQDYSNIRDKKLVQALELINQVVAQGHFQWDLHNENLALRLTPHGPQLVLMDPIS